MVEAVGVETPPGESICVFMRGFALLFRTEARREPSQLLQTATTDQRGEAPA